MGLFSFLSFSSPPSRTTAIQTGAALPTRAERERCWTSRDAFFACLSTNAIADPIREPGASLASSRCGGELRAMEHDCAAEWVKHFKLKYVADLNKKRRLEELERQGANRVEIEPRFMGEGRGKAEIQEALGKGR